MVMIEIAEHGFVNMEAIEFIGEVSETGYSYEIHLACGKVVDVYENDYPRASLLNAITKSGVEFK